MLFNPDNPRNTFFQIAVILILEVLYIYILLFHSDKII